MKKISFFASVAALGILAYSFVFGVKNVKHKPMNKTFYDLKIKSLDGEKVISFADFKGKKVLCVNTASACGYTGQYKGLQYLSEKYKNKLVVIGFPCNQFGNQEPGDKNEIQNFCKLNYGITFLLTEKIDVKGEHQHEVYQWLCQKNNNGKSDYEVKWNFSKFLIDENGNLQAFFPSAITPESSELINNIEK
ncbi:MAG: glutathione peroxidase [Bacteroidia bacterium]|nr:glutathione peroxidase [Bacteroidia bacterium]